MSYSNGDGSLPYPQSRTGSISYNPAQPASSGFNYFASSNGSRSQQQQPSSNVLGQSYPVAHQMPWPPSSTSGPQPPSSVPALSASTSSAAHPVQAAGAPNSTANSIIVESPTESRSDTDEPTQHTAGGSSNAGGKRKGTEDPEGARSKKKRNRAVLSCAPCKSRKVGLRNLYYSIMFLSMLI